MWGNFGSSGEDLRKAIADMTKRLYRDNTVNHLEAFLACRLIPLDKQPGVRPIGIGEILRHVTGKITFKKKTFKTFKKRCSKGHWIFTTLRRTRCRQRSGYSCRL